MRHETSRATRLIMMAALAVTWPALAAPTPNAQAPKAKAPATKMPVASTRRAPKPAASTRSAPLSEEQKIRHALNRLAFGPRPGDAERVRKIGLQSWINEQLNPAKIDDREIEARLAPLKTLSLSPADLLHNYEAERLFNRLMRRDQKAQVAAASGAAMPSEAATNEAMPNGDAMQTGTAMQNDNAPDAASTRALRRQRRAAGDVANRAAARRNAMRADATGNGATPGAMNASEINGEEAQSDAMPLQDGALPRASTRGGAGGRFAQNLQPIRLESLPAGALGALQPPQRALLQDAAARGVTRRFSAQAIGELASARLLRAVESKRQLNEVMVDFWSNHFNLDVKKGLVRAYKIADERDAIRPHVWGKFRDLLGASAKSPAMLFYLDNFRSTHAMDAASTRNPNRRAANNRGAMRRRKANAQTAAAQNVGAQAMPQQTMPQTVAAPKKTRGGVNENYARELMELHTLGVEGGYTQKDVQEVARCLTGWTINRESGEFIFRPRQHDNGEKIVLGQRIPAGGGQKDGERVLDILAKSPATARHIAKKLCVRLVSDAPSDALVERVAQTFLKTDGDLRETVRSVVASPEFFAGANYDTKVKSPFEFAVSSVRALDGHIKIAANENAAPSQNAAPQNARPRRVAMNGTRQAQLRVLAVGAASLNPNQTPRVKTLAGAIATMGQPLFSYQAPTGYPENSQFWVSAGALVSRLNFALDVTGGAVVDVSANPADLTRGLKGDSAQPAIDRLGAILLGGDLSASTRATLEKQFAPGTPPDAAKICALLLGSPEFQRR